MGLPNVPRPNDSSVPFSAVNTGGSPLFLLPCQAEDRGAAKEVNKPVMRMSGLLSFALRDTTAFTPPGLLRLISKLSTNRRQLGTATMPYGRYPDFGPGLACLEIGALVNVSLGDLFQAGRGIKELWQQHGIEFTYNKEGHVQLGGRRSIPEFFKAHGVLHDWLELGGFPVEQFVTRPSLYDPRNILISPRIALGVMHMAWAINDELFKAGQEGRTALMCFHWPKGESDWSGTKLPVPYPMASDNSEFH